MKQETLKEIGKFILDLAKIIIAIAVITPLVKDSGFHIAPLAIGVLTALFGIYL